MFFGMTTDTIVKPILKMLVKLENHAVNQLEKAAQHDQDILDTIAKRDVAIADAEKAKKIAANLKTMIN